MSTYMNERMRMEISHNDQMRREKEMEPSSSLLTKLKASRERRHCKTSA